MKNTPKILLLFLLLLVMSGLPNKVFSDIYVYVDPEGVSHFTNIRSAAKYKIYLKSSKRRYKKRVVKYDKLIKEASNKYKIDFSLIKAMIKVESDFNPRAISKAGARGLMQIMPGNMEKLRIKDPFDPRQNIMGGSLYLQKMIVQFPGDLSLALAAYNAGPSAVSRYKKIPPYRETERYVEKVMKYYSHYKKYI